MDGMSRAAGLWIGTTVCALGAGIGMVVTRCRLHAGFSCGDWPRQGITWHFLPLFILGIVLWWAWSRLLRRSSSEVGIALAPGLGLTVTWTWYGITDPAFHHPDCTTPVICHDVTPSSVVIWSAPWLIWMGFNMVRLWWQALVRGRHDG
jgi:hypothetical protein